MRDEDPLESLLAWAESEGALDAPARERLLDEVRLGLTELIDMFESPGAKLQFDRLRASRGLSRFSPPTRLPADVLATAENVARTLWPRSGSGKGFVEEGLLMHIAFTASASSLPFFRDALAFTKPRDPLTARRRRYALAGVAFVARQTGSAEARELLRSLLAHDDLRLRALAVDDVGLVKRTKAGTLTAEAARELAHVAQTDRAFEPRALARAWLAADGRALPLEHAGGAYAFEATLDKIARTVELRSEQTLGHLAWAIVGAFGWDSDHLYQFRLSETLDSLRFTTDVDEGVAAGFGADTALGDLGLHPGHHFEFLYDFGDHNLFRVTLVAVRPQADARATYPRVTKKVGRAPAQYPR
jgi:hypothetical protein